MPVAALAGPGAPPAAVVAALETPGHKVVNMEGANHVRVAQFVIADGRGYLVTSTLPALSADHTYQLWAVINGQTISLGLMGQRPNQTTFTLAGSPSVSRLAITVEPVRWGSSAEPAHGRPGDGLRKSVC